MKREELLSNPEYWMTKIQVELFNQVNNYLKEQGMTRVQLANRLGVSKGYISQIMNGNCNHRLSKIVELSLAIGKGPVISFDEIEHARPLVKTDLPMDTVGSSGKRRSRPASKNRAHQRDPGFPN